MTTILKPSTLIAKGLKVEQVNNLTLFKFTEELGDSLPERLRQRLQILIDKKKADSLTPNEMIELELIGELDEIFSYINTQMASRESYLNLYIKPFINVLSFDVNIVITQRY